MVLFNHLKTTWCRCHASDKDSLETALRPASGNTEQPTVQTWPPTTSLRQANSLQTLLPNTTTPNPQVLSQVHIHPQSDSTHLDSPSPPSIHIIEQI